MSTNKLSARLFGQPVGILEIDNKGRLHFNYLSNATKSISLSLPYSESAFDHRHCHRFFKGLLPQNDNILNVLSKILDIEPNNTFEFLRLMGHDCIGAISFHSLCSPIEDKQTSSLKGKVIPEKELAKHLENFNHNPLLVNTLENGILLPGIQPKAGVCLIDNQIAFPEKGSFSTHILKVALPEAKQQILNEYFFMRLASRLGLYVCRLEIRKAQKIEYLLIKRFDREIHGNIIKHYHQEDFCQALGFLASRKFQIDGGPGFNHCFQLLQKTNIPAIDRNYFIQMIIFNYLIGNTQAHSKNMALLYLSSKYFELAPFYDLGSYLPLVESTKMAMSVADIFSNKALNEKHWGIFCHEIDYSYPAFKLYLKTMMDNIVDCAKKERLRMKEEGQNMVIIDALLKNLVKNIHEKQKNQNNF